MPLGPTTVLLRPRRRPTRLAAALICAGILGGCRASPGRPGEVIQAAGPGEDLRDAGPLAVAWHPVRAPARYDDVVETDVYYPSDAEGYSAPGGPRPLLMLVHEEGIPPDAFRWLALHLASWGLPTALPAHPLLDPSLAADNADWARDHLLALSDEADTFVSGALDPHQLGLIRLEVDGDAVQHLDEETTWDTVAFVGAEPHSAATSQISATVLAVAGAQECVVDARTGWDNYQVDRALAIIEGMSHGQLVDPEVAEGDDGTVTCDPAEAACDPTVCDADIDRASGQRRVAGIVAAFELAELADGAALEEATEGWEGITLEEVAATPAEGDARPTP